WQPSGRTAPAPPSHRTLLGDPRQSSPSAVSRPRPRLDGSVERQCDTSREAGMEGATVALADATRVASGMRIAIAVFEGAEELDFVGPWEVLTAWRFLYPNDAEGIVGGEDSAPATRAKGMQGVAHT